MPPIRNQPGKRMRPAGVPPYYKRPDREVQDCRSCRVEKTLVNFGTLDERKPISSYTQKCIECRLLSELASSITAADGTTVSAENFNKLLQKKFEKLDGYLERSIDVWHTSLKADVVQNVKQALASIEHDKITEEVNQAAMAALSAAEDSTIHDTSMAERLSNDLADAGQAFADMSAVEPTSQADTAVAVMPPPGYAEQEQPATHGMQHNTALLAILDTMNVHLATISGQLNTSNDRLTTINNSIVATAQHTRTVPKDLTEMLKEVNAINASLHTGSVQSVSTHGRSEFKANQNRNGSFANSTHCAPFGRASRKDIATNLDTRTSPICDPRTSTLSNTGVINSTYSDRTGHGENATAGTPNVDRQPDYGDPPCPPISPLMENAGKRNVLGDDLHEEKAGGKKTGSNEANEKKICEKKVHVGKAGGSAKLNTMELDESSHVTEPSLMEESSHVDEPSLMDESSYVDGFPNVDESPDVDESPNEDESPDVDESPNVEQPSDAGKTPNADDQADLSDITMQSAESPFGFRFITEGVDPAM